MNLVAYFFPSFVLLDKKAALSMLQEVEERGRPVGMQLERTKAIKGVMGIEKIR